MTSCRRYLQYISTRVLQNANIIQGTNIFSKDWDVLLILDACRKDLFDSIGEEFGYQTPVNYIWSVGSSSRDWMENTFTEAWSHRLKNTAYITGNVWTHNSLRDDLVGKVDEVWKYAFDEELSTVPPRPLVDQAIRTARSDDFDRIVVHFMQPHHPFLHEPNLDPGGMTRPWEKSEDRANIWRVYENGGIEKSELWEAFKENLRIVLSEVELLRENIDADTLVITADHGNSLRWPIYGHPMNMPLPSLRRVPWIETNSVDNQDHSPRDWSNETSHDDKLKEKLRRLGYLS